MTTRFVRAALALSTAGVLTAALAGGVAGASPAGHAAGASDEPSTPVTTETPDGKLFSYIINTAKANPGHVRRAERAIAESGGVVVQSWPGIGVVVAHSDRAAFRTDMRRHGGKFIESMGPTRYGAVYEGTPEGIETPWTTPEPTPPTVEPGASKPDPLESEQWALKAIKADRAHKVTEGSRDVLVGVLDTGIDPGHPDLKANLDASKSVNCTDAGRPDRSASGWRNTVNGHGTHVAGTIAAARNGTGVVGVAPKVRVASVKVSGDENMIFPEYAVCGFMWAAQNGFDVTNNSYYVDPFTYWCADRPEQFASVRAVQKAVEYATKKGVVHAAAAGNQASDLTAKTTDDQPVRRTVNNGCRNIPAELEGVAAVSAVDSRGRLASFSNRGLGAIDVAAPGQDVMSSIPDGGYDAWGGTSMASPHVAGVLALMRSAHPHWSPARMLDALRNQAEDHACEPAEDGKGAVCEGPVEDNSYYGEGVVDALAAVR
ncbi:MULTISPECIES: S8 family peptidase [unclassified Streptomyces]|uniref:S8 family peptidase n=1 Tax=unclassified Streptomyces TaxID=2593676 RepID=UPI0037A21085